MQVDAVVGQVLDTLEKQKLAEQTLVIFTSDNGAHWLATDIEQWKHRANANWRGMKADIWEGGHRVPFIVRWPKVVTAGSRREELLCLTDVFATVAEILGLRLAPGEAEDSFSFLAAITGEPAKYPPRESIVHQAADGTLGVRQGAWKLATKLGSHGFSEPKQVEPDPDGPQGQLYNLAEDPAESRNRWLGEPAIVKKLLALLEEGQAAERTRPE
jgi:arylsulfatase A-like enzyme